MQTKARINVLLLLVGVIINVAPLQAQEATTGLSDLDTDTTVNNRFQNLTPPSSRFGPGPEGWLKVRYSLLADGSIANLELLEVMPTRMSTTDLVKAMTESVFEPEINSSGNPIDWHNNVELISFDNETIPNVSGPQFPDPYERSQTFFEENKLDRARSATERILREYTTSLYDIGLANNQLANIEIKAQNFHAAYTAISNATQAGVEQLANEELEVALQYKFAVEITLGRYFEAYQTYERRQSLTNTPELPSDSNMATQAEAIRVALESGAVLGAKAKIIDNVWQFIPSRRAFTLANIEGQLDDIDVICNRKLITLDYQVDIDWALPESWGNCALTINGQEGTTFTFYEFE